MNDYVFDLMMKIEDNTREICNSQSCKDIEIDKFYEENKDKIHYIIFNLLRKKLYRKGSDSNNWVNWWNTRIFEWKSIGGRKIWICKKGEYWNWKWLKK